MIGSGVLRMSMLRLIKPMLKTDEWPSSNDAVIGVGVLRMSMLPAIFIIYNYYHIVSNYCIIRGDWFWPAVDVDASARASALVILPSIISTLVS